MQVTKAFRLVLALMLICLTVAYVLYALQQPLPAKVEPQPVVATPLKEEIKDKVMDIVASREELSLTVGYDDPENVLPWVVRNARSYGKEGTNESSEKPLVNIVLTQEGAPSKGSDAAQCMVTSADMGKEWKLVMNVVTKKNWVAQVHAVGSAFENKPVSRLALESGERKSGLLRGPSIELLRESQRYKVTVLPEQSVALYCKGTLTDEAKASLKQQFREGVAALDAHPKAVDAWLSRGQEDWLVYLSRSSAETAKALFNKLVWNSKA